MPIRLLLAGAFMLWLGGQRGTPLPASPPVQARQAPLSVISGQIRTADGALPIHRARIVLTGSDRAIGPVFTDDKGGFTLQGPANGRYVLDVTRPGFVPLRLEHVPGAPGGAWDIRRVVISNRQPAGGGSVMVFSTDPEDWYERSRYVRAAEAGENGQFSVGGLAPGDYWMVALDTAPPAAYRLTSEFLRRLASFATHVSLSEGQHRQAELRPMKTPR